MPAPDADVMTPDTPERTPPAPEAAPEATTVVTAPPEVPLSSHDAGVLFHALARVGRLLGYSDEHLPEFASDIDATGVDTRIAGLVEFAKRARLP